MVAATAVRKVAAAAATAVGHCQAWGGAMTKKQGGIGRRVGKVGEAGGGGTWKDRRVARVVRVG